MCPEFDSQTLHSFIIYMINFIIYCILSYGVVVSTVVSDAIDPGSNPGRRFWDFISLFTVYRCLLFIVIGIVFSYGVVVSTMVFDTIDPGSNPGRRCFQVSTVVSTSRCGCEILSSILRLGIFGAVV